MPTYLLRVPDGVSDPANALFCNLNINPVGVILPVRVLIANFTFVITPDGVMKAVIVLETLFVRRPAETCVAAIVFCVCLSSTPAGVRTPLSVFGETFVFVIAPLGVIAPERVRRKLATLVITPDGVIDPTNVF